MTTDHCWLVLPADDGPAMYLNANNLYSVADSARAFQEAKERHAATHTAQHVYKVTLAGRYGSFQSAK